MLSALSCLPSSLAYPMLDSPEAERHIAPFALPRSDAADEAANDATPPAGNDHAQQDLPNEVWGEIARFASRGSVLNLRATSRILKAEADTAITTMSLSGNAALCALSESHNFQQLRTLRVAHFDSESLQYFAMGLARRLTREHAFSGYAPNTVNPVSPALPALRSTDASGPPSGLRLELTNGLDDLTNALICLSDLPLAALRLIDIAPIDATALAAFQTSRFPIELKGRLPCDAACIALSRMPTLAALHTSAVPFTEAATSALSSHRALRKLTLGAVHGLSSRSVEHIAAIPNLQELVLEENLYMAQPISYPAARMLGANLALHTLRIHTSSAPPSDASFEALSSNTSIRTFQTSIGPGLHHIRHMTSLETLVLGGRCANVPPMTVNSARSIAGLEQLRSLTISSAFFSDFAWPALLDGSRLTTLSIYNIPVSAHAVVALLANTHLRELTIANGWPNMSTVTALCNHPTLQKLTIDGRPYPLRANHKAS